MWFLSDVNPKFNFRSIFLKHEFFSDLNFSPKTTKTCYKNKLHPKDAPKLGLYGRYLNSIIQTKTTLITNTKSSLFQRIACRLQYLMMGLEALHK